MKKIVFLVFLSISAWAQTDFYKKGRLYTQYENKTLRNPYRAFLEVAIQDSSDFVPLFQGVPLGVYSNKKGLNYRDLTRSERKPLGLQAFMPLKDYKLDFYIQPQFIARFGNYHHPVESKTNIMLNTQLNLARGLVLHTGVLLPLINDLDSQPMKPRFSPTYLNYFSVLAPHHYLSASGGFFFSDQYGANLQYRYQDMRKPLSVGLELGNTAYYRFMPGVLEYSPKRQNIAIVDVAYRHAPSDVTLKLSAGQFLHNDKAVRMDFIRQMTNIEISLFGVHSQNGTTIGFNFAIPIPPNKTLETKVSRLRTGDEFRWEYLYVRGYKIAEKPRFYYNLDEKLRQFHISHWKNQASR